MRPWRLLVVVLGCLLASGAAHSPSAPQGVKLRGLYRVGAIPYPSNDPYSPAKAKLGRLLFFEPLLSGAGNYSCASCHSPTLSWADGLGRAVGSTGKTLSLRAPTLLDVAWSPVLGWDGKFRDLEHVAFGPVTSPDNMNNTEAEVLRRLRAIPGYIEAFAAAFPGQEISRTRVEEALATFERTIVASDAPFDHWVRGDEAAISPAAKRGFDVFNGKAGCANCHSGPSFSDGSFQDIGSATGDDIGRARLFPNSNKLHYAFKVPTLRDVARRAPYMHDGSVPTLEAVINLYDKGGIDRPSRSELIYPLGLTLQEKADLVAFLQTLTGAPRSYDIPVLPR